MNFLDLPTGLFCRVGQHASTNQERANLAMTCRAGREMMTDYPWSRSEYDGLVPHRQAPQDSHGWLELNRERVKLRARPAAQLLRSCRSHVKKGKPERALAFLAPGMPELHLYYGVMREALRMQGRDSQRCALDDQMLLRGELKRALIDADMPRVRRARRRPPGPPALLLPALLSWRIELSCPHCSGCSRAASRASPKPTASGATPKEVSDLNH